MLAKVLSSAVIGIDAYIVQVEVDISQGLPAFTTVGLAEGAVRESKERVRAAIRNSGYAFPEDRITVNLAPADVKKEGSAFDLPIALGILAAAGACGPFAYGRFIFLGELALDGTVQPVKGALPMAATARSLGMDGLFLPKANAGEAAVVEGIQVVAVESLAQLVSVINGERVPDIALPAAPGPCETEGEGGDFSDVAGQEYAKRALEIAAAGGHNVLMVGPPGAGKTMLARRLPGILPELGVDEALETSKIYSVMGLLQAGGSLLRRRPFRAPHHTISDAGLIGGGNTPMPGEVSLAHNGVLFLDELAEFRKNVLEVLRQPLEDGHVTIARARSKITYPARFMLVGAMNPCPCGFLGDARRECRCAEASVQRYRARISGPLLDRIDIHLDVPAVPFRELNAGAGGMSSAGILARVVAARGIQAARFKGRGIHVNAGMGAWEIRRYCKIDRASEKLLEVAMQRFALSARAHARILKIARTIADLDGGGAIRAAHVAEGVQYRLAGLAHPRF